MLSEKHVKELLPDGDAISFLRNAAPLMTTTGVLELVRISDLNLFLCQTIVVGQM